MTNKDTQTALVEACEVLLRSYPCDPCLEDPCSPLECECHCHKEEARAREAMKVAVTKAKEGK